jgi:3-dehydroquinate synthase
MGNMKVGYSPVISTQQHAQWPYSVACVYLNLILYTTSMSEAFLDISTTVEVIDPVYRAIVQENGLDHLPTYLDEAGLADNKALIITDSNLTDLYGEPLSSVLIEAGIESRVLTIKAGETNKSLAQVGSALEDLTYANATRKDVVIALGGGVVGDLGGFVASIYNRGVPLVQVPTTLLAMVDSSIGGKTGVDHGGKNKTGSFYQPKLVLADPTVLSTLDQRVYTEGFGEIAKYAILDASFLPELEEVAKDLSEFSPNNVEMLSKIISRCVKQKSDVIAADPHEQTDDGRVLLNYGHTLGHGLEAAGGYDELLHGEAIAIGMNYVAQLAVSLRLADQSLADRQVRLLESLGLPTQYEGSATIDDIMKNIAKDKKNTTSGSTRLVLPAAAGQMIVSHLDNSIIRESISSFLAA